MVTVLHGVDFSGDVRKWTAGCGRSNVWISTARVNDDGSMRLVALRPVQGLSGNSHPFKRLVELLADGEYSAAGIDAPFGLPARHMPYGGLPMLLRDVGELTRGARPFAKGEVLVAYGEGNAVREEPKPLRKTERFWRRRVNVRSTLWNGARGGAAFTAASLTLLAEAKRPVWPWCRAAVGLLVEVFPAAQLHQWGLRCSGYDGSDGRSVREEIVAGIRPRIEIPDDLHGHCLGSGDALDSVLCLFGARAAAVGVASIEDSAVAEREGWIAVDPE